MSDLSAELAVEIEPAIRAAVQKAGGGMVTGALTLVTWIDAAGATNYAYTVEPGQRSITTLGLLHFATLAIESQIKETLV